MYTNSIPVEKTSLRTYKSYWGILGKKWLGLLLVLFLADGCKKVTEEDGLAGICPEVLSTNPANNDTGVDPARSIEATFNEKMDASTIDATTFLLKQGTTQITGLVTYTDSTAVFSPTNHLIPNTQYTGTITTGAKDRAGNAVIDDYHWTFTTGPGPDIIPPTVISTDPVNLSTGVVLDKQVSAVFSEKMDSLSVTTNFTLVNATTGGTAVAGTVAYSGVTAIFSPLASLAPNTTYTATISTGAKDSAGNALTGNYVWNFTTGVAPDRTAPTVVSTDPANLATGVVLSKIITATFSEPMTASTITATTFTLKNGAAAVAGTVTYTGTTATFTPTANLAPNTVYTGMITTGAKDLAGNALASNYVWTFTSGPAPDVTAPTVVSTDPANAATGVILNKIIRATFSEAMTASTITTTSFTVKNGANAVAGTVTYTGNTASFTPTANLAPNTLYTGTITTGAKDLAGNALASNYVWTFTTMPAPDVTVPTVTSTDPANAATGVVLTKIISATFSEAMTALTINTTTFTVKNGIIPVAGTVTYSGTTATFTPSVNLLANTVYTGTITTGAKDLAGNALVNNYVWTFTTVPPVIPPPSLGSASIFGSFGGSAGITNQGLNTVINNGSIGTTGASTLITGFHDGTSGDIYTETPLNKGNVTGRIYTAPPAPGTATSFAVATQGLADAIIAYNSISPASKPGGTDPGAGELGGLTLPPGIYQSASGTFKITNGNLTLNAMGDPNAVWIFQTAAGLTVGVAGPAGARSVVMINGGLAKNVFWYVGSSAVINGAGGGIMTGNILASAGITFSTAGNAVQTVLNGRAISLNASVTMVNTTINVP